LSFNRAHCRNFSNVPSALLCQKQQETHPLLTDRASAVHTE